MSGRYGRGQLLAPGSSIEGEACPVRARWASALRGLAVTHGLLKMCVDLGVDCSGLLVAIIPKLIVRVRLRSSAATRNRTSSGRSKQYKKDAIHRHSQRKGHQYGYAGRQFGHQRH